MFIRGWHLNGGDPTPLGWLTTFAFFGASVLCAICAWHAGRIFQDGQSRFHRIIWAGMSLGLVFFGINKQLDLQSTFTSLIKQMAWRQGWYASGQQLQILFIAGMALLSLVVLVVLAWTLRRSWKRYWILLLGLLFLARFVITRAASFYGAYLPRLSQFTGGFRINWLLEPIATLLIGLAAAYNLYIGFKASPNAKTKLTYHRTTE